MSAFAPNQSCLFLPWPPSWATSVWKQTVCTAQTHYWGLFALSLFIKYQYHHLSFGSAHGSEREKKLLWPTKALLEIILSDLRPFGMEGIYCFDLIKAEKLIWHPVVKETNSHTKENSCDGIIQTIQVTLGRKKGFSSKDLYSTHFTTVEIKIIALYAYWKAVFNLGKEKCHIFFHLPDPILCWEYTHKHTYHLFAYFKEPQKESHWRLTGKEKEFL